MQTDEYFHNKSCVATGAASGIGFAVSEALLKAGAVARWMILRQLAPNQSIQSGR